MPSKQIQYPALNIATLRRKAAVCVDQVANPAIGETYKIPPDEELLKLKPGPDTLVAYIKTFVAAGSHHVFKELHRPR